jgi:transposase
MDVKQREARRLEAVRRLGEGQRPAAVAEALGVAPNTVYAWGKRARLGGKKALKAVPKAGRPLKLEREHWAALKRMVLKGPSACGFDRQLWTLPLVGELIQREFGVSYHDDHLSKFMRRLGLSRQKPAVRAKERDERAIGRFVKTVFPELEKKPGPTGPR